MFVVEISHAPTVSSEFCGSRITKAYDGIVEHSANYFEISYHERQISYKIQDVDASMSGVLEE